MTKAKPRLSRDQWQNRCWDQFDTAIEKFVHENPKRDDDIDDFIAPFEEFFHDWQADQKPSTLPRLTMQDALTAYLKQCSLLDRRRLGRTVSRLKQIISDLS